MFEHGSTPRPPRDADQFTTVSFADGDAIPFGTSSAKRLGDEILVLGQHHEGMTLGAASGTLRCVQ